MQTDELANLKLPTFAEAWARYKAKGYQYGDDALGNVGFGYRIALEELALRSTDRDPAEVENERLREALKRISNGFACAHEELRLIARLALQEQ